MTDRYNKMLTLPGIYRWRIILADTDYFQQSVSVLAADFRGRNNRPSAKHFFIKLLAKQFSCSEHFGAFVNTTKHVGVQGDNPFLAVIK